MEQAISALWRYVNKTLQFAMEAGVQNAVNYHRAACAAALHSPPLYDPLVHDDVARYEHLIHIAPYIRGNSSGHSPTSRKRNRPAAASPDSTATSPQPTRQTANGPQRLKEGLTRPSSRTNARSTRTARTRTPDATSSSGETNKELEQHQPHPSPLAPRDKSGTTTFPPPRVTPLCLLPSGLFEILTSPSTHLPR